MTEFQHHYKARGSLGIFFAIFAPILGLSFILSYQSFFPLFLIIGVGCVAISVGLWRSVWKKDEWQLHIDSGVLLWDYPGSCEAASGRIALDQVDRLVINDECAQLLVVLKTGEERKIALAVSGYLLNQHLSSRYPHISIEYKPSIP
jgi:hypothetical protein